MNKFKKLFWMPLALTLAGSTALSLFFVLKSSKDSSTNAPSKVKEETDNLKPKLPNIKPEDTKIKPKPEDTKIKPKPEDTKIKPKPKLNKKTGVFKTETIWDKWKKTYSFDNMPFDIIEYPTSVDKETQTPEYFIGSKDQIQILTNKFINEMNYGPEIAGLKDVVISHPNLASKKKVGTYYLKTGQIFINPSSAWKPAFLKLYKEIVPSDFEKIKIQWLHQVLAHEYGHHLFHYYVNSPHPSLEPWTTTWLLKNNPVVINTYFLNRFEELFGYKDAQSPISKKSIEELKLLTKQKKTLFMPFAYSLKELYESANYLNKDLKNWDESHSSLLDSQISTKYLEGYRRINNALLFDAGNNHWNELFNFYTRKLEEWLFLLENYHKLNIQPSINSPLFKAERIQMTKKTLKYKFSLHELLTRKQFLSIIPWTQEDRVTLQITKLVPDLDLISVASSLYEEAVSYLSQVKLSNKRDRTSNTIIPVLIYLSFYKDDPFRLLKTEPSPILASISKLIKRNRLWLAEIKKKFKEKKFKYPTKKPTIQEIEKKVKFIKRLMNVLIRRQKREELPPKNKKPSLENKKVVDYFMNLIWDFMGVSSTYNISMMMPRNTLKMIHLKEKNKLLSKMQPKGHSNTDYRKIILGGFLTPKQRSELGDGPYNIIFGNKVGPNVVVQKKIYKRKKFFDGKSFPIHTRHMWYLPSKNFIDVNDIKNKQIFLQGKNGTKVLLKTYRGESQIDKNGLVSSWINHYQVESDSKDQPKHIYKIAKGEKGGLVVKKDVLYKSYKYYESSKKIST